jgi:hypothetical protein
MRALAVIASATMLAGCGSAPDVPAKLRATIVRELAADQGSATIQPVALWWSGGKPSSDMVCGEIPAPALLQPKQGTLRFMHSTTGRPMIFVERHALWKGMDTVGEPILDQNRAIFDATWDQHCRPAKPYARRFTALTGIDLPTTWSRPAVSREEIDQMTKEVDAQSRQLQRMKARLK